MHTRSTGRTLPTTNTVFAGALVQQSLQQSQQQSCQQQFQQQSQQ